MFKRNSSTSEKAGWRDYQKALKAPRRPKKPFTWPKIRIGWIVWRWVTLLTAIFAGLWILLSAGKEKIVEEPAKEAVFRKQTGNVQFIEKSDLPVFIGNISMVNLTSNPIQVDFDGRSYQMHTSLDMELQQYLLKRMDRVNSRYIGIVAMKPDSGRILAMAGFNKIDPDQDPCLLADYPAASLFKIVTAAAGAEEKGYTAQTRFTFNGFKHTLYKRQLTDKQNRYTNAISLKGAFAQSVNPVFGKIGALYLKQEALEKYGNAFGFNREVTFEFPLAVSHLTVKSDSYHRAEIASGFNRQTTISPIHGAMIASIVLNDGIPVEPTVIDTVEDKTGMPIYRTKPKFLSPAVTQKTAKVLNQLMVATVSSGTARKTFRGHSRSKVLSRLRLGGKTGSIYNRSHDARFDWYIGFAEEMGGNEKLAVSVMVAHEEYIGTRAGQYARWVIERHFKKYFANKKSMEKKNTTG